MKKLNKISRLVLFTAFVIGAPLSLMAQMPNEGAQLFSNAWISQKTILYALVVIIVLLLIFTLLLYRISNHFSAFLKGEFDENKALEPREKRNAWEKLFQLKAIATDKDTMTDHSYDGIRELDNPPPPWFMFLFYGSIVIGVFYFIMTIGTGIWKTQDEAYLADVEEMKQKKEMMLASLDNAIDETSVVLLTEAQDLEAGAKIFKEKCVACHKTKGEGSIGPNLTDNYWLHGGDIASVFSTIKYGVVEKGMQAWKDQFSPKEMQQVSSYILNLEEVPISEGGKEPQGDLFVPEKLENDSTKNNKDTTNNSGMVYIK